MARHIDEPETDRRLDFFLDLDAAPDPPAASAADAALRVSGGVSGGVSLSASHVRKRTAVSTHPPGSMGHGQHFTNGPSFASCPPPKLNGRRSPRSSILPSTLPLAIGSALPRLAPRGLLLALASSVAAVALRWALNGLLGDDYPFVFSFGAVALCAALAGWEAALLAGLVSAAGAEWLFISPRGLFLPTTAREGVALASFCLTAGIITALAELMRRGAAPGGRGWRRPRRRARAPGG